MSLRKALRAVIRMFVFTTAVPIYYKAVRVGGRGIVEDIRMLAGPGQA
jgi:hypothetical protein